MRRRLVLALSLAVPLAVGASGLAGVGPKGGPPFNQYVCTGTVQITTEAGTKTENWNETLFFYKDGKKKRFATTEWLGKWWKKQNGADGWKWSANLNGEIAKSIEFNEPGVKAKVIYKFRKLKIVDGLLTGVIKVKIKRTHPDGTKTKETWSGSFTGVGS